VGAGLSCDKTAVLGETIKGTPCIFVRTVLTSDTGEPGRRADIFYVLYCGTENSSLTHRERQRQNVLELKGGWNRNLKIATKTRNVAVHMKLD